MGKTYSAVLDGIDSLPVEVEADVSRGLPSFQIVGLPDSTVSESKARIRSAIKNSGIEFPNKRITVNLSPAGIRKRGAGLDLAIALAILQAAGHVDHFPQKTAWIAELALTGELRPVPAALRLTQAFCIDEWHHVVVSKHQHDAEWLPNPKIWLSADNLRQILAWFQEKIQLSSPDLLAPIQSFSSNNDFSHIHGLDWAKRGLEITASGRMHTLLIGPPGSGKTTLAQQAVSIFPSLSMSQAQEVISIHRAYSREINNSLMAPVVQPHHSCSVAAMIGGGKPIYPGEATFAHHGILILDELLEFPSTTLQALREPLVEGTIRLARGNGVKLLPAQFTLIATTNPCPCGEYGFGECSCTSQQREKYWKAVRGPLLDRFDLCISVGRQTYKENDAYTIETSKTIQKRIVKARELLDKNIQIPWEKTTKNLLDKWAEQLRFSYRAVLSVQKVAHIIALLEQSSSIHHSILEEAISYRNTSIR
ncbi:YifB family Mg chelatase-like AAA ATPase [Alicyclobacillus tolerans]|nr:YifB family Mg chelatase-like AAA ATPase [Alicyclobacillus montanus]